MNIYQKINRVQRAVDVVQKDSSGYGYTYVSQEALLPRITAQMERVGLSLIPKIVPGTVRISPYTYERKKKAETETVNQFFISAELEYTWVNNDNPSETVVVNWFMTGNQGDSSQTLGSALTYAERYFLLKFFHIATVEDDPDKIRSQQKQAIAKSEVDDILAKVDRIVQFVLSENADERSNITQIVTKYVDRRDEHGNLIPSNNYFNIKKKAKAAGLLRELEKTYDVKQ